MLGAVPGMMSAADLPGPQAATLLAPLRLARDQTRENLTGAGAPPWTWPRGELALDVLYETVFSLATGAVADRCIAPLPTSSARGRGPGLRLRGFA